MVANANDSAPHREAEIGRRDREVGSALGERRQHRRHRRPSGYHLGRDVRRHPRAHLRRGRGAPRGASVRGSRTPDPRSVKRIVRENVFTLVNAIALGFLVLIAIAGAWNDAIFAAVIAVNAMIGIGQELSAKRKLDQLALLVAPRARVRRDGVELDIPAEDIVPDDIVELQPGDQIVADGVVGGVVRPGAGRVDAHRRVRPGAARSRGDQVLSGAYCAGGAGLYRVSAVGADSYASQADRRGARRQARASPPLQLEINRLLRLLLVAMVPLAVDPGGRAAAARHRVPRGRADRDGGPHLDRAGGPRAAGIGHVRGRRRAHRPRRRARPAAERDRVARVGRHRLPGQDGHAHRRHAGAGRGRAGAGRPRGGRPADPGARGGRRQRPLGHVATPSPRRSAARRSRRSAEVPFASRWKWSGAAFHDEVLVLGAPEALGAGPLATEVSRRQGERSRVLVFGRADVAARGAGPGRACRPRRPASRRSASPCCASGMRPEATEVVAVPAPGGRRPEGDVGRRARHRRRRGPRGGVPRHQHGHRRRPAGRPGGAGGDRRRARHLRAGQPRPEEGADRGARPAAAATPRWSATASTTCPAMKAARHLDRPRLRLADRARRVRHRARRGRLPRRSRRASSRAGASSSTSAAWRSCSSSSRRSRRR